MPDTTTVTDRQGRAVGRFAQETRDVPLTSLEVALYDTPWRKLSVYSVAAAAEYSPSSFYLFFAGIEDAFDALMARRQEKGQDPTEHMQLISDLLACERAVA